MAPLECDGPKVWAAGKPQPKVIEEPRWQTIDHLQAAKSGRASYMGDYDAVWSGTLIGGRYVPPSDLQENMPSDLQFVLKSPQPRLALSFVEARYTSSTGSPSTGQCHTEVRLKLKLTYAVQRWKGAVYMPVERCGSVQCVEQCAHEGSRVVWEDPADTPTWFPHTATHLGFTLEVDSSPLKTPFVYLEWTCGSAAVLMLFKKCDSDGEPAYLTHNERARLGIGMTHEEFEVAHILSIFQSKWVDFTESEEKLMFL
ncbi:hypothetical protein C8Q74DRAFT_1216968 [Fomes fomentarius]|nr:hypothetical protein C8Q74DRAFT_1216968 [Fomes fomentarius]